MKQNPTIPAVLAQACAALWNITVNPENRIIAGAAGAVQVNVSASSYPTLKKNFPRTTLHPKHLPIVLHPLSILYSAPLSIVLHPHFLIPLLFPNPHP